MKIAVEKNQEKIEEYEKFGSDKNQKIMKVVRFPQENHKSLIFSRRSTRKMRV